MDLKLHDPCEMAAIAGCYLKDPEAALALVTLVEKTGSSYRLPGARMLVRADGTTLGTISGGCLERDLAELAMQMEQDGQETAVKTIDTRPIFGCQGTITLFVERIRPRREEMDVTMLRLQEAFEHRQEISVVTFYRDSEKQGTRVLFDKETQGRVEGMGFVQRFSLKKRLLLVGAHADIEPVIRIAQLLGWQCMQLVPGAQRSGWIAQTASTEVLHLDAFHVADQMHADAATAVVIMTHNLGRDLSYARHLLPLEFGYIGMLGSTKRRQELMHHLMELGDEQLILATEKLHCPIGLNIGSETSEAIALSIVSEIQAVFSGREGGKLRDVSLPIHPHS